MLVRIVRMTFAPDALPAFLNLFDDAAAQIRAFDGCRHLELWQDVRYPGVVTTYSHWDDGEALHRYRHSELFRTTWNRTKPMFAAPPSAHSHQVLRDASTTATSPD